MTPSEVDSLTVRDFTRFAAEAEAIKRDLLEQARERGARRG